MSVNQESEQLAPHAAESFVSEQDATTKTGIQNKSVSGKSAKRRKVEVAEHMKYYKATAKRRALEDQKETRARPSDLMLEVTRGGRGLGLDTHATPRIVEFLHLEDNSVAVTSTVKLDEPLFQPYPSKVVFESYEAFGQEQKVLYFRNNDTVNRRLRLLPPESPNFIVSGPRSPHKLKALKQSKVAPGMQVCYVVTFKPQDVRAYAVELFVLTEREKFVVPVEALGHRAVLDFPDKVAMPHTAVKATATKTILVRNLGTRAASVSLSCEPACTFDIHPSKAMVPTGASAQLELRFHPEHSVRYEGELVVEYDSGEKTYIALSASAGGVDVYLSTPSLQIDPAYIGLSSQKTLKIVNRSEIPVKFAWETFATAQEEEEERRRLHAEMAQMQSLEEEALLKGAMTAQTGKDLPVLGVARAPGAGGGPEDMDSETRRRPSCFGRVDDEPHTDGDETDDYDDQEEWIPVTPGSALASGGNAEASGLPLEGDIPSAILAGLPPSYQAAQAALKRKYRNLRRALAKDRMLFADDIFEIRPLEGQIWAKSEIEVTVFLRPRTTADYDTCAFLDCVGREERLPLFLGGVGIGPKLVLSFDVLDMGDIFISSKHSYEVTLLNRGDIPADWMLQAPQTPFASKFRFRPTRGTLEVKDSVTLEMEFESDILGEFSEFFRFILRGNEEPVTCQLRGHVIGPTFHFDVDEVDFGAVSYECPVSTTVGLTNTSDISMPWRARVPQDGTFRKKEITITPSSGNLSPGQRVDLLVELVSQTVKVYEYYITVDVDKIGVELLSIPLKADCQVPTIKLESKDLTYGECFVRFHEPRALVLINTSSKLTGLFRVVPQEALIYANARVAPEPEEGQVPPGGRTEVKLWLTCERLGRLRFPMTVEIQGSVEPPLQVMITATGIGPIIKTDLDALNWGPTRCLADAPRVLRLSNPGKIPAPFKIFLRSSKSKFRVNIREGVLAPSEEACLTITANLDDTTIHRDELHIIVNQGQNRLVFLKAKGTGSTVWCAEDISSIDFGPVFTNSICIRRITLENRGRRQQALKWVNSTVKERQMMASAKLKAKQIKDAQNGNNRGGAPSRPKSPDPIEEAFTVTPTEIELCPRTAITLTFRGFSSTAGRLSESLYCEVRTGKEKLTRKIFKTEAVAEFVAPLLNFSQPEFHFSHVWDPNVSMTPSSQSLRMTNTGLLPLDFTVKTQAPFSVDVTEHSLKVGEIGDLNVSFDPGCAGDSQSRRYKSTLSITYHHHPQKDGLPLVGDVAFPNLDFECTKVSFGCVLNDTTMTKSLRVTNNSIVDCAFSWSFLENMDEGRSARKPYIPVNQIFDILPIRSFLRPGEWEEVEFVYYGHANRKVLGKCACDVTGGQVYTVDLVGEASNVGFRLDKAHLDFGHVLYTRCEERELHIINTSRVPFPFRILLDKLTRPKILQVQPTTGVVQGADDKKRDSNRARIVVRFRPGLPEKVREVIVVEAGHFDPVEVPVYGTGAYATVAVSLPRDTTVTPWGKLVTKKPGKVTWKMLLGEARKGLVNFDPSFIPPDENNLPPPPNASSSIGLAVTPGSRRSETGESEGHCDPAALLTPTSHGDGNAGGKIRRVGTPPRSIPASGGKSDRNKRPASALPHPTAGGRVVTTDSVDGRSPTAAEVGKGVRTAGSGASLGRSRGGSALGNTDVEMEANRLAYVSYLQMEAEIARHSLAAEAINEANSQLETTASPDAGGSSVESIGEGSSDGGGSSVNEKGQRKGSRMSYDSSKNMEPTDHSTAGAIMARERSPPSTTSGGIGSPGGVSGSNGREDSGGSTGKSRAPGTFFGAPGGGAKGNPKDLSSYVIARHVADFGNVVVGFTKTKAFRVVNTSKIGPVSWSFDKNDLAGSGYSVEPEKVVKLPQKSSAAVTASFQARKGFPHGIRSLELPIKIKNGPQTIILLRANVTSPQVELSHEEIDFGNVLVGQGKTRYIQVHNVSPVIADWDFKLFFGDPREESRFKITPRSGSLHRDQRVNVEVEFAPTDDRMYCVKMGVRVTSATKIASVVLQGRGAQPRLRFDPPFLKLGPVLPHMPEGHSIEVEVINESAWDVEIFSVDFDQAHLEEEEIISRAPGFTADKVLRLPPRLPGEGLHHSLLDAARAQDEAEKRAKRREAKALGLAPDDARDFDGELDDDDADDESNSEEGAFVKIKYDESTTAMEARGNDPLLEPMPSSAALIVSGGEGTSALPAWDRVPSVREEGKAHDIVVTGPPLSGKSTLSHALGARYGIPALTVDEAVKEAMRLRNKLGANVRAAMHYFTAREEARWVRDVEAARERVAKEAAERKAVKTSKRAPPPKKNKKAAAATAAALAAAEAAARPTEAGLALETLLEPKGLTSQLLTEVLRWRLAKPDCERGVVLDGFDSRFAAKEGEDVDRENGVVRREEVVTARAVAAALPNAQLLVLFFKDEKHGYASRLERLKSEATFAIHEFQDEFAERSSSEGSQFVGSTPSMDPDPCNARDCLLITEEREGDDGAIKRDSGGVDVTSGDEADNRLIGAPKPQPMKIDDLEWNVHGDHKALPAWKNLSEDEQWTLDDKQLEEHFRMAACRRRTEYDRARRILTRLASLPTESEKRSTAVEEPPGPVEVLAATGISKKAKDAPKRRKTGRTNDTIRSTSDENMAVAAVLIADPYGEYVQNVVAYIVPIFEALSTANALEEGLDSKQPEIHAAAVNGGKLGADATTAVDPDKSVAAVVISDPRWSLVRPLGLEKRIFRLEIASDSSAGGVLELAHGSLPAPAVPAPDPKLLPIPPDKLRQLIHRSLPRTQRPPTEKLEISTPSESSESSLSRPNSSSSARAAAPAKGDRGSKEGLTSGGDRVKGNEKDDVEQARWMGDGEAVSGAIEGNPYRWVIRAGASIRFVVKFTSSSAGTFDLPLTFETVGTGRRHTLHTTGTCAFPSINADPRNVFMRRVKHLPEGVVPPISKRYVVSKRAYEFGPLLTWKRAESRLILQMTPEEREAAMVASTGVNGGGEEELLKKLRPQEEAVEALRKTNSDVFRLSNDGHFPVKASMAFEQQWQIVAPAEDSNAGTVKTSARAAKKRGPGAKSPKLAAKKGKRGTRAGGSDSGSSIDLAKKKTFYVEPETLELAIGETKEIRVWAFPTEVKVYKDTLIVCLTENPRPVLFPISCVGASPRMVFEGPWDEAIASVRAALEELGKPEDLPEDAPREARAELKAAISAAEARVRQTEESGKIINFDRLLLGRVESQDFVVRNVCQVPCRWRVDATHSMFTEHPDEFRVVPSATEGVIEVGGTARVSVMFSAQKEGVFEPTVAVEYTDDEVGFRSEEEAVSRVVRDEVKVVAEAYRIRAVAFETPDEAAEAERAIASMAAGRARMTTGDVEGSEGIQPRTNDGSLDFGRRRVGDSAVERFTLRNRGKYDIAFAFRVRRGIAASLFKVEPSKGVIEPGKANDVCVTFCSIEEVHLKDNRDIRCVITEPHTGEAVEEFSVVASAVSTWSRFRMQPRHGINFGPVAFNAGTLAKTFELKNEGEFEFVFIVQGKGLTSEPHEAAIRAFTPKGLFSPEEQEEQQKAMGAIKNPASPAKGPKGKGKKSTEKGQKGSKSVVKSSVEVPSAALFVGRFEVATSGGLVQPGQSVSVTVRYSPEDANAHRENICLKVSGSDPSDALCALAASYDLLAESCVPGITTSDWREIFEEQAVIPSLADVLDESGNAGGVRREGVARGGRRAGGRVCFAEDQRMFTYGSVVSSQAPVGVCERFKITNINKIPCTVKFSISPSVGPGDNDSPPPKEKAKGKKGKGGGNDPPPPKEKAKGKKGKGAAVTPGGEGAVAASESSMAAFTVHPEMWEIPPHEHRYVSAYFRPTEMRSYSCRFEAKVVDNDDPSTGRMEFLMSGNGTMPTVTLESPVGRDPSGVVIMDFGEVCARKSRRIPLTLRNDGILPVSCLFELETPEAQDGNGDAAKASEIKRRNHHRKGDFLFAAAGGSVTLQPKEKRSMEVIFQPRCKPREGELVSLAQCLKMTVLHNPFDAAVFRLSGTCLSHDVVFDDLPGASGVDELIFEQVDILSSMAPSGGNTSTVGDRNADAAGGTESATAQEDLAGGKEVTFSVCNQSPSACRFQFAGHKHFKFSPSTGHLPPGGRREIQAVFNPKEPIKYDSDPVEFVTQKIRYPESDEEGGLSSKTRETQRRASLDVDVEWDDSKTQLREATEEDMKVLLEEEAVQSVGSAVPQKPKKGKGKKVPQPEVPKARTLRRGPLSEGGVQMVYAIQPEPRFKLLEGTTVSKRPLRCSGVADRARYEVGDGFADGSRTVPFGKTHMFQCRVHKFIIRNPGITRLPYEWCLSDLRALGSLQGSLRPPSQLRTNRSFISFGFEDMDGDGETNSHVTGKLGVPCPFTVEPWSGDIEAGNEQTFTVRFAPQEVHDFLYALVAKMPTLPKDQEPLRLTLRGRSLRPVCHFALQESPDYLQRRQADLLSNELGQQGLAMEAASVRVLEVISRGTHIRNTQRFYVVNPTSVGYDFSWEGQGNPHPAWRCVTQRGMILAGKRGEMAFEFTPDDMDTAEAFFRFRIPDHGVSELFLLAGVVVEPDVTIDRTRVDFGALILGASLKETFHIVNREPMPHSFVLDKNSLGGAQINDDPRRRAILEVSPTSALLPPNGRVPIEVTFCPREEKFHNFNLVFKVRKKQTKLSINVKGEGFKVHAKLLMQGETLDDERVEDFDDTPGTGQGKDAVAVELFAFPQTNVVDFGSVHINERASRKITIVNPGKFSVDYLWQWGTPSGPALKLSGAKQGGSVKKGDRVELSLDFLPTGEVLLGGVDLICTVAGRYEYILKIVGKGIRPGLQFSFLKHDFGPCFITPAGSIPNPECVILKVTNRDPSMALSLDCLHQMDRCFWVTCEPSMLEAGESLDVPLRFAPRDAKQYAFGVPFLVNGSYTVKLLVVGEGCPARLELANLAHKHLTFGMVPEGKQVTKQVKVVNRSKRAIEFELVDAQDLGIGKLESKGVRFIPALPTSLAPRASTVIGVFFSPETRLPSFTENLFVRAGATSELRTLLTVSGQSTGMEVCLGVDTLPFGTVCSGSQRTQRLGLENRGDLPARFRWVEESFGAHFTVSPLEGMIAPLTEARMQVVFTPEFVDDDIRQEGVLCAVEGYSPLSLTLTGSCVPQPADSIHTLSFKSCARQACAQSVTLENPTDKNWFISPVLKGEHWQGAGQFQVPAKGKADYTVEFLPLAMTLSPSMSSSPHEEKKSEAQASASKASTSPIGLRGVSERNDSEEIENKGMPVDGSKPEKLTGSLFFALPDGGAVLYMLEGVADAPKAASVVKLDTPAKTVLAFTVPVYNWLRRAQRFTMRAVLEDGTPSSTKLSGGKTIEVPALTTKDFALSFLAYKEGVTRATVTFTNEATQEYLFHEIRITTTPPSIQETIELEASVRSLTRRLITVVNPLRPDELINFTERAPKIGGGTPGVSSHGGRWWRCSSPHVRLTRVGEMAGNLEGVFAVDYRPLVVTEDGKPEEADLSFDIEELGTYRYALQLSAKPAASRPSLFFVSALGSIQSEAFSMKVFNSTSPVEFECHVGGSHGEHFRVPPKVIAPPCASWDGQDVRVKVVFEPERTGDVEGTLVLTSEAHGSYSCELKGVCRPPLPQGPFKIAPGEQREIPFRNIFASAMDFSFICDHPAFVVTSGERQNVPAKSTNSVTIQFSPEAATTTGAGSSTDSGGSASGKLIMQCVSLASTPPWIFYLHGVTPHSS